MASNGSTCCHGVPQARESMPWRRHGLAQGRGTRWHAWRPSAAHRLRAAPAAVNRRLAHRHLGLLVDGLRHGAASGGLASGPALTLDELAAMAQGPDPADRPPAQGDPR
jgi:hypothetical protein